METIGPAAGAQEGIRACESGMLVRDMAGQAHGTLFDLQKGIWMSDFIFILFL